MKKKCFMFSIMTCILLLFAGCTNMATVSDGEVNTTVLESKEEESVRIEDDLLWFFEGSHYCIQRDDGSYDVSFDGKLICLDEKRTKEYLKEVSEILSKHDVILVAKLEKTQEAVNNARKNRNQDRNHGKWNFDGIKAGWECDFIDEDAFLTDLKAIFSKYE